MDRFARDAVTHAAVHGPRVGTDDAATGLLSVVFVARGGLANNRRTLDCLRSQTVAERIELIVSVDSASLAHEVGDYVAADNRLATTRCLVQVVESMAQARRLAAVDATGVAVVFVEDHGFPEPRWAEELLAAFASAADVVAAAPLMLNPHEGSAVSRAQFSLFHGANAVRSGASRFVTDASLPWHSTAYRRGILAAVSGDAGAFAAESFLQERMRQAQPHGRFVRCQHASVEHVNMTRLLPALQHAFHGGRIFGGERARRSGWSIGHRLVRAALFPLVALLKIRRSWADLWDGSSLRRTLETVVTAIPIATCHAAGEAVGSCFGTGGSPEAMSDFEVDRVRFLRPADWHLLRSVTDAFQRGFAEASSLPRPDGANGRPS